MELADDHVFVTLFSKLMEEPQVQVQFTTQLDEEWRVTEAPIQLPTRLTRHGLSEVVNHLLEGRPNRPFDFLLQGELLRGPLSKSLTRLRLSGEEAITLEYVELLPAPEPERSCPHPDWITAVACSESGHVVTGCYDNASYVWSASGERIAELRAHTAPVKGVAWLAAGQDGGARAVSASKDQTVRTWQVGSAGAARCEAVGSAHKGSVECVCSNPAGTFFSSGGWDGVLQVGRSSPLPRHMPSCLAAVSTSRLVPHVWLLLAAACATWARANVRV